MMRILFVMSQFIPHIGGTEINLARLMGTLRRAGHDVELVTLRKRADWPAHEVIAGAPVTRVSGVYRRGALTMSYGLDNILYFNAARALRQHIPAADIVYCAGINPLSGIAARIAQEYHKPALVRIATTGPEPDAPGSDETRPERLLAGPLDPNAPYLQVPARTWVGSDIDHLTSTYPRQKAGILRAMRGPNVRFIALTSLMRDRLIQAGFAPERITIIPNGLDEDRFVAPRNVDLAQPPTALVVARHSFEKGVDVALQAWRIVHDALPEARLILCGDGPLRGQYAILAAELDIAESVTFRGAVKDVAAELATADCFILPSRWEGFPVSLLEASVAGVPAVATRVSGVSDVLREGETGYSVPVADYAAMADRIIALLSDRVGAQRMGEAAARHARATFTQAHALARFDALCQQILPASAPREETAV